MKKSSLSNRKMSVVIPSIKNYLGKNLPQPKKKYGCLMIPIPSPLNSQITQWCKENIEPHHLDPKGLDSWPHVTVKYGFENDGDETFNSLKQLLRQYGPIRIKLQILSLFKGTEHGDVLKLSVKSDDLIHLNSIISSTYPTHDSHPDYLPHMTLAYLKPEFSSSYTAVHPPFLNTELVVDQAVFSDKQKNKKTFSIIAETQKTISVYAESSGGALVPPALQRNIRKRRSLVSPSLKSIFDYDEKTVAPRKKRKHRYIGEVWRNEDGRYYTRNAQGKIVPAKKPGEGDDSSQSGQVRSENFEYEKVKKAVWKTILEVSKSLKEKTSDILRKVRVGGMRKLKEGGRKKAILLSKGAAYVNKKLETYESPHQQEIQNIAKQRKLSPEQTNYVEELVKWTDFTLRWTTNVPVVQHSPQEGVEEQGVNFVSAVIGYYAPVASMAFLANTKSRNPLGALRTADRLIQNITKGEKALQMDEDSPSWNERTLHALCDLFLNSKDPNWTEAVFVTALDRTHNIAKSVEMAQMVTGAYPENPINDREFRKNEVKSLPDWFTKAQQIGVPFQGPSGRWFVRRQSDGRTVPAKAPGGEAAKPGRGPKKPDETKPGRTPKIKPPVVKPKAKPKEEKVKKEKLKIEDVKKVIEEIRKKDSLTSEDVQKLADTMMGLTVVEIQHLRKEMGIKASGLKAELAKKVAAEILKKEEKPKPPPEKESENKPEEKTPEPEQDSEQSEIQRLKQEDPDNPVAKSIRDDRGSRAIVKGMLDFAKNHKIIKAYEEYITLDERGRDLYSQYKKLELSLGFQDSVTQKAKQEWVKALDARDTFYSNNKLKGVKLKDLQEEVRERLQSLISPANPVKITTKNAEVYNPGPEEKKANQNALDFAQSVTNWNSTTHPTTTVKKSWNGRAGFVYQKEKIAKDSRYSKTEIKPIILLNDFKDRTEDAYTAAYVHELGHLLEEFKGVRKDCVDFINYRCGNETFADMGKYSSNMKGEMGRKDNFERAFDEVDAYYIGKIYEEIDRDPNDTSPPEIVATEVLSMGIQKLYQDPIGFMEKDPEYAQFVIGILRR